MTRSNCCALSLSHTLRSSRNSFQAFSCAARTLLLLLILLTVKGALAQYDVGGNGVQPTEATNGEVSLDTLNIHLDIPIVSKAGVGLPLSFGLHFNNNIWLISSGAWSGNTGAYLAAGNGWYPNNTYGITGFILEGPRVTCNGIQWATFAGYEDSKGNTHAFGPVILASQNGQLGCPLAVTTYKSLLPDGSGITVNLSYFGPNTVTFKDGTVATVTAYSASMVDVNNNKISVATIGQGGAVTDTLGVTELTPNGADCYSGGVGGSTSFSYHTSTGTAAVTINCTNEPIQTSFGCSGIAESTGTSTYLPTSINLPDGSSYTFTYESQVANTVTGRLASVTYPSGEEVSYTYTGGNNGINCSDGSTAGLTRTLSTGEIYTYTRSANWLTTTLVGPSPANNKNVYTFIKGTAGIFLSQSVENQGSSTPLRTKVLCYNGNQTSCVTAAAPTLPFTQTDVYTTLAGMTASSRVSTTLDAYGNTTKSAVYDFGATSPTRQTVAGPYGYTWNGSTTSPTCSIAIGSGVQNKPCQVQLQTGLGSQLRNTYLQYGTTSNPGSLLSKAVLTGGSTYLTTSATYNANGTVATATDANGNKTVYTQGACNSGFLTKVVPPITALDTQYTWDPSCYGAKMMSLIDPNGFSVSATYDDPFWRPKSQTDQLNNVVNITYGYSPLTVEQQMTFGSSDFDVFNTADALGRPLYAQQIETSGGSWDTTQMGYSWNTTGRVITRTMPCATTKGSGCSNGTTTTTYDALGRLLVNTDGGGGTITFTYSGSSTCTSPLLGCEITTTVFGPAPAGEVVKQSAREYNGLGQLVASCSISTASGSTSCGFGEYSGFPTTYNYNSDGTLASVSKSSSTNTQTRSFTYDALGRTLTATYPESGKTTFTYDTNGCYATPMKGLLVFKTDANGNSTCYTYDSLNRLVAMGYGGPNWDGNNKFFVYDSATVNGVAMVNTLGRLAEAYTSPDNGVTKITDEGFSYTARGEASDVYESTPNSNGYYHTTASYFANGALNTLTGVPGNSGSPWTYGLDGKGRPFSATESSSNNMVSSTTYNAANEPCIVTLGLGDTDTYLYDNKTTCSPSVVLSTGRMTKYTFSIGSTPKTFAGSLTWNANGTLRGLATVDGINSGSETETCAYGTSGSAGYDEFGRLLQANCVNGSTNVWNQTFSYDIYNNVTKSVPTGGTGITWAPGYNATNNQYALTGTSYDSNGNLLTDTFHTYTWNQDNHPKAITDVGITMTYDAFGRMVEKATGSTYQQTLISPIGPVALMSKQNLTQYRMPLPGGDTDVTGINFYHRDYLGSVPLVSSRGGRASVAARLFGPYGESYNNVGISGDLNFTGDYQDLVAGTFDTPNRELNPTQGRWISPDPAHASWNAYSYSTNPLGETDPSGLDLASREARWDSWGCCSVFDSTFDDLLNPGAAFINSAIQDFQVQSGQNSPVSQGLAVYIAQVDAGFNALQPGYVPDDNADRGEKIYVFCGGEDTSNMSCAPAPWSDRYLAAGWQPYRVGWPAITAMFDSSYRMSAGPVNVTFVSTGIVVAAPTTSAIFSQAGVAVVLSGAILSKFLSDAFGLESEEQTFVMPEQPHIPEEPPSGPAPITEPAPISGPPIP